MCLCDLTRKTLRLQDRLHDRLPNLSRPRAPDNDFRFFSTISFSFLLAATACLAWTSGVWEAVYLKHLRPYTLMTDTYLRLGRTELASFIQRNIPPIAHWRYHGWLELHTFCEFRSSIEVGFLLTGMAFAWSSDKPP